MGLDVTLYKCDDWESALARENEYEDRFNEIWNSFGDTEYEDLTDEQKEWARVECNKIKEEMGLGEWGEDPSKDSVNIPKDWNGFQDPCEDHIFQLGYFRSSYNPGGINNLSTKYDFPSLYDIFIEANSYDAYYVAVDWETALVKVNEAIEILKAMNEDDDKLFDCIEVSFNSLIDPKKLVDSPQAALDMFIKEHAHRESSFSSYRNAHGHFFLDGFQNVKAVITGARDAIFGDYKEPVAYVIYERTKDDEYDPILWCLWAYIYVRGTIEYVLAQPDSDQYRLAWSG
jgi:hypothetical protein